MPNIDSMQALYSRLSACGVSRSFARRLLPEWWDDSIASNPVGLLQAEMIIASSMNFELKSLRDASAAIQYRSTLRKFKHSKNVDKASIQLSAEFATGMARFAVQAMPTPYVEMPRDPAAIRRSILSFRKQVDLESLLAYCTQIVSAPIEF